MDLTRVSIRIQTKRRTPMPAKVASTGENTCKIRMRIQISDSLIYHWQADTFSDGLREGIKYLHSWIQAFHQPFISIEIGDPEVDNRLKRD